MSKKGYKDMKKKILSVLLCIVFSSTLVIGCARNGNTNLKSTSEEIESEGGFSVNKNTTCITPLSIIKSKKTSVWYYADYAEHIAKDMCPISAYIFQDGYLTATYSYSWTLEENGIDWPTYGELSKMSISEIIERYESLDGHEQNGDGETSESSIEVNKDKQKYSVYGISDDTGNELQYEILGYKGEPPKMKGFVLPDPYYYGIYLRASSEQVFPIYESTFIGFRMYDPESKNSNYESHYFLTKVSDENTFTALDEVGAKGMEVDPDDYKSPYENTKLIKQ